MIENEIESRLNFFTHYKDLSEIMAYASWPAGKIFRPKLIAAISNDLKTDKRTYLPLACAVEFHHAYTLVHDDLPSMDNDQFRRGKLSTHAKFGEWKAILAGDALLIHSFQELKRLPSENLHLILKLMCWCTGAKGLIAGQFFDLSHEKNNGVKSVIRIHELKTARLIQVCTLGSFFLSNQKIKLSQIKNYMRLGASIGISFQLLDDLQELNSETISKHEMTINPFISDFDLSFKELSRHLNQLNNLLNQLDLKETKTMMKQYLKTTQNHLNELKVSLEFHLGDKNTDQVLNLMSNCAET